MKIIPHLQKIGFDVTEPRLECNLLTANMHPGINSRDFGHSYEDMQDMICGNLYLWLQQSYQVLWKVDELNDKVIVYTNTSEKLGERFATLLSISKEEGKTAAFQMVEALALANYITEKVIFNMEGNWLLRYRNTQPNGLLKLFVFWLASTELAESVSALSCMRVFMKKFAKDINLDLTSRYTETAVIEAFIQCFFHGQNEVALFVSALQNSKVPIYESR